MGGCPGSRVLVPHHTPPKVLWDRSLVISKGRGLISKSIK